MRSLLITLTYCSFFFWGIRAPYVFMLGYVWVDIFTPQSVAYSILPSIPVSLIIGVAAILSLFTLPRDANVRIRMQTVLVFFFALWMTATLGWAEVPTAAWAKWDWAIKAVGFSCLVPMFIRSRIQFEALLWVIVLSGIAHCIPFAAKVLVGGGGYGQALGLVAANSGYGESSTLAMFAVSLVPIILYLLKHSVIVPRNKWFKPTLYGMLLAAVLTSLGTYARTGLICTAVLLFCLFFKSRRKGIYLFLVALAIPIALLVMGGNWSDRMATTGSGNEASAMGRVAVWFWTLGYVAHHPLGGGFDVYRINYFELPLDDGTSLVVTAKAFHSVYFEVLGELGLPGIILYAAIALTTLFAYRRVAKQALQLGFDWLHDAARSLIVVCFIFFAGGLFIGVAFQSYFYYLVAISAILLNLLAIELHRYKATGASSNTAAIQQI